VAIIDDHGLFATAARMALRQSGWNAYQLTAADNTGLLAKVASLRPGLAVLDLHVGRVDGTRDIDATSLVRPLRAQGWTVLVISDGRDRPAEAATIADGAVTVLSMASSFDDLLQVIRRTAAGLPVMTDTQRCAWLDLHRAYQAQYRALDKRLGRLSTREREVLHLLAQGRRAADVAQRLTIALTTVRSQIRSILCKLEVGSQLEAVALLHRRPPPAPPRQTL
jgi:DNA-binding NarL/FixJ family response regulator